jgi:hypothetical protein
MIVEVAKAKEKVEEEETLIWRTEPGGGFLLDSLTSTAINGMLGQDEPRYEREGLPFTRG